MTNEETTVTEIEEDFDPAELVHSIHHCNFPTTDPLRTAEWYKKVFGLKHVNVSKWTPESTVLILSLGKFDLHFHPVKEIVKSKHHFAIEVEDWDKFIAHIERLGLWYETPYERPQNNSMTSELRDPDGHHVEIVYHAGRDW